MKILGVYQVERWLSSIVVSIVVALGSSLLGCAAPKPCLIGDRALASASSLRKLPFIRPVECRTADAAEVKKYLRQSAEIQLSKQRIALEGKTYELLGLIEPGHDYLEQLLDIYARRLAAVYSPELKFFILPRDAGGDREAVVVHELTHVLQDHRYDARALLPPELTTDAQLARSAVLEGDANRVMRLFQGAPLCREIDLPVILSTLAERIKTPPYPGVSPALDLLMTFAYPFGERFLCAAAAKHGRLNLDELYRNLPATSQEVIFPERYFARPAELAPAAACPAADFSESLGAFGAYAVAASTDIKTSAMLLEQFESDCLHLNLRPDGSYQLEWRVEYATSRAAELFAELIAGRPLDRSRFGSAVKRRGAVVEIVRQELLR